MIFRNHYQDCSYTTSILEVAVRVFFVALMTSADLPWPWPADPARPTKAIRWHNATGAQGGQKFSLRKIRKDGPQKPLREMG